MRDDIILRFTFYFLFFNYSFPLSIFNFTF